MIAILAQVVTVQAVALLGTTVFFCISLSRNSRFRRIFEFRILTIQNILLALFACPPAQHLLPTAHDLPSSNPHLNATRTQLDLHNRAPLHLNDHRVRTPMRRVVPQILKQPGIVEVHRVSIIASGIVNAVEGIVANILVRRHNSSSILPVLHLRNEDTVPGRHLIQHIRHASIGILNRRVDHQLMLVHLLITIRDIGVMTPVTMGGMRGLNEVTVRRKA